MKKSGKTGFTLIELLVAMTIIAVLMGISLVSYQGVRKSSRDGIRKADLEQTRSALEMCRTDVGSYPIGNLSSGSIITCGGKDYMTIPDDPLSDRNYAYFGDENNYTLCASLETGGSAVTGCGSCTIECNYKVINP
jgi:prepilin-type N-terminal cleavage/methylation domain-containing protein